MKTIKEEREREREKQRDGKSLYNKLYAAIPAHLLRQVHCEFESSLGYIARPFHNKQINKTEKIQKLNFNENYILCKTGY
jgi:hypothetical protein